MTEGHAESVCNRCYCHIRHRPCQAACAAGGQAFIVEQRMTRIGGETWRWMSAAAGASGDRVLASDSKLPIALAGNMRQAIVSVRPSVCFHSIF